MVEIDTGTEQLLCTVRDRVAIVTLNKPHKKNALGDILTPALRDLLPVIEADDRVGVVMITGAGDAFCSGGDVSGMGGASSAPKSEAERIAELTVKQETFIDMSVERCRVELFAWYRRTERDHPDRSIQKMQDLTPSMLG